MLRPVWIVPALLFLRMTLHAAAVLSGRIPPSISPSYCDSLCTATARLLPGGSPRLCSDTTFIVFADSPAHAGLPEWGGGGQSGDSIVIVPSKLPPIGSLQRVLQHEYIHLLLNRVCMGRRLPRWFHEGCAMHFSGELGFESRAALAWRVLSNNLPPFAAIESVNSVSAQEAAVIYAVSHATVALMQEYYGNEFIAQLIGRVCGGYTFDQAVNQLLGISYQELLNALHGAMTKRYTIVWLLGDFFLVWLGILTLAFVAWIVVRVRRRSVSRQWDSLEDESDDEKSEQQPESDS
jgi:hypothetical protein